jgi:hypothetical protein
MTVIDIDETTDVGRDILRRIAENPKVGKIRDFEIPFDDEDLDDFPHFTEEELNRMRAEILADNPEGKNRILTIPRDENGNPIGTPWEEVLEDMYDDLSKHFGVDLRTL